MHYYGGSKVTRAGYGVAGIVGAEAITATIPEPMRLPFTVCNICGAPCLLRLLIG
jgi:hypothetical protein